jgi:hypothetical protein
LHFLTLVHQFTHVRGAITLAQGRLTLSPMAFLGAITLFESSGRKSDVYDLLWAVVFGFATLNILSLVVKRFEPDRNRMTFGEMLAVMTVIVAVFLLGWEMLYLFKVLPIRLSTH